MRSPVRTVGSTILRLTCQRGEPSARAASRNEPGTTRITSSAVRIMTGSIRMARAMLAANPEKPLAPLGSTQKRIDEDPGDDRGCAHHAVDDRADQARKPVDVSLR